MPRNVRPSWCDVSIADTDNAPTRKRGHGPRSRKGTLAVRFKVRSTGSVLDLLDVDAIGSAWGDSVLYRVTDKRTGKVLFEERFAQ